MKDPTGEITTMKYDVANRLKERTLPNGVKSTYEYDDLNRVKSIVHTNAQGNVLASVTYERKGKAPTIALREVQLQLWQSKEWKSPYYWAAFTLQGDWK